jgi:hypothetical protein
MNQQTALGIQKTKKVLATRHSYSLITFKWNLLGV